MAFEWAFIVVIVQLIFLEGILSIDNAAVLGALVAPLPDDQDIVWPKQLQGLGRSLQGVLGNQRMAALRVGLLGAYVGRGLMLFLVSLIIQNPWIKLVGAAYLIRLAFDSLSEASETSDDETVQTSLPGAHTFWMTVLTVELMDLVFSIDNVVAAVSLSKTLWVVLVGVAIGILMMRFAAGLFSYAVEREPVLKQAAYILVLVIGVELVLEELWHIQIPDLLRFGISVSIILFSLAYEHFPLLRRLRFVLVWFGQGFGIMNELVDWLLMPLKGILGLLGKGLKLLRAPRIS